MSPQKTKAYKKEKQSVVSRLAKLREETIAALESKDLSEEKATTLTEMLDKITKNHQLLTGEATENTEFRIVEG